MLADIAEACGGFLYADPAKPVIHLLPKYQAPAWQAHPADVVLSLDAVKTLSTTDTKRPLYNTVTLVGQTQGGIVYRSDMGQDKDAPVASHPLYTEQACIVPAGIAILSDSGDKRKISLSTMLGGSVFNFAQHNKTQNNAIPLAKIGSTWQIGAGGDTARVVSVLVSATVSNGVVSVWQSISGLQDGSPEPRA